MKNRLKEARFFSRISQIQLWLETGIHYSTISRIECGYIKPSEEQKKSGPENGAFMGNKTKEVDSEIIGLKFNT